MKNSVPGKLKALSTLASILNITGVDSVIGRPFKGVGAIFVLHSVVVDRRRYLNDKLHTSAHQLDQLLAYYRRKKIDIVSLDEAANRLKSGGAQYFVCFTFDDGYRDNLSVALPIFKKYNAPFTVYVTTAFIKRRYDYWWRGLQELIKKTDSLDIDFLGQRLDVSTFAKKVSAYRLACNAISKDPTLSASLKQVLRGSDISIGSALDEDALSEIELQVLATNRNVEIGAHTNEHSKLSSISLDEAYDDIIENKSYLERLIGREVNHFAYPFGDRGSCGRREFDLVKDIGFKTATTSRIGTLTPNHAGHLTALPRLRIFSEIGNNRIVEFQRTGGFSAVSAPFQSALVTE